MIHWLRSSESFPPIEDALADPNGLLAAGGDLSPERLLDAYRHGIFPWYSDGQPVLWWSPDPRMVLFVDEFKVSRSLRRVVSRGDFDISVDKAFRSVIEACAEPRDGQAGTWITQTMIDAYTRLHRYGYAHSVEAWVDDELAGGLYGVAIGRMFFGESMFARVTDGSKVALVHLVEMLKQRDMPLIDCQQQTPHLARLGARPIPRRAFAEALARLVHSPQPAGAWSIVAPPGDAP
ncbi:MAG TPA: leucyl/phenylalanyl-tRNA--protein transferase [Casimicrobiaceae bacterium]|nr:leucyl/phenylalanyl-tRNA--protein transferase [Casimicrobiaceae bacterium]